MVDVIDYSEILKGIEKEQTNIPEVPLVSEFKTETPSVTSSEVIDYSEILKGIDKTEPVIPPASQTGLIVDMPKRVEVETEVPLEAKSFIDKITDLYTKISGEREDKKSLYKFPHAEHMARALGVDKDPGELVGFDPSGMDRYEKLTGKPRYKTEKRTKPSPYERTMAELAIDPKWNKLGKRIYDYEQKNKDMSSVLELPADWGETALIGSPTDIKKGTRMNYGEWLQERFSKGFFDVTSLGITLAKASGFPDKIKDAWREAIDMETKTDWDKDSFKRGAYHTITDPIILAPVAAIKAFQILVRTIGGKAASQAGKHLLLGQLKKSKIKEGVIDVASKYSPVTSVQRKLMSEFNIPRKVALQAAKRKEPALKEIAGKVSREDVTKFLNDASILSNKARALIGPLIGATWAGAGDLLTQSLHMQLQMASPKLKEEYEQQLALGQPVPKAMRKHFENWMKSPEEKAMNRDVITQIVNHMLKSKEPNAQGFRTEAKRVATERAKKEGRKPTQKEIDGILRNAVMDKYMTEAMDLGEKEGLFNLESPDSFMKWFKQIDWERFGGVTGVGAVFGGVIGAGTYVLGKGFNKWASNRRRKKDELALSLKDANISDEIEKLKSKTDTKPIVTKVIGEITDEGPSYSNEWTPLPLAPTSDKLIISGYIPKGSNKEYIFNEAVKVNNSLTTKGIFNLGLEEGTTKRQAKEIINKFKLANIELTQLSNTSFEGRKIKGDLQLSATGRPISDTERLQIETTTEVIPTSEIKEPIPKFLTEGEGPPIDEPLGKVVTPTGEKLKAEVDTSPEGGVMEGPLPKFLTEEGGPPPTDIPPGKVPPTKPPSEEPPPPPSGEPLIQQRSKVTEFIGKVNTLLGRGLTTTGALPVKLADLTKERKRDIRGTHIEVRKALRDLKAAQKKTKTSNEDLAFAINEGVMEITDLEGKVLRKLPIEMQKAINDIQRVIQVNENTLNDLLGLKGEQRIGLKISEGDVYFTRSYEATFNPKYLEKIRQVLDPQGRKKSSQEFIDKVDNARNYFINTVKVKKEKGESEQAYLNRIDGVIENLVTNLSREDKGWFTRIFEGENVSQGLGAYASKVLKERKNLDAPILELLGEQKNPYKKVMETLTNQSKLISEIQFLKSVEKFANENSDKVIDLGGLISFLPRKRTAFSSKGARSGGITTELQGLVDEAIGKFGARKVPLKITAKDRAAAKKENIPIKEYMSKKENARPKNILENMYTTKYMAKIISDGTDLALPKGVMGKGVMGSIAKLSAFGQAGQTILDFPAYILNLAGAVSSMGMNGYLIRPSTLKGTTIKNMFGGVRLLLKQARAKDAKAVEELARLKREGVIETDVAAELIDTNMNLFQEVSRGGGMLSKTFRAYEKGMKFFGNMYGLPDSWSKIAAHRNERQSLKWMFPDKSDDEIFSEASRRVRSVMPSYGDAFPFAKGLSRLPIGTYALFPSEIARTFKNTFMLGMKDIGQGLKSNNYKQAASGLTRLTAFMTTLGGIEYLINDNNEANGITDYNERFVSAVSPDWGKGTSRYYLQPFQEGEDGRITARYMGSSSFDAYDYVKLPARQILGKLLAGKNITEFEIDEVFEGMRESIVGPYTNTKFLIDALLNVAANMDRETGQPLYPDIPDTDITDRSIARIKEIGESIAPGTAQVINKYLESRESEKITGKGLGRSASGFPLNSEDIQIWMSTGMRPVTMDVKKAMGYNLSKDLKTINNVSKVFNRFVSTEVPHVKYTPEVGEKIVNKYLELQEKKYKGIQNLSDKIRIFSNVSYYDRNNKKKDFGIVGVLRAATSDFWYDPDEKLVISSLSQNVRKGIFIADNPAIDNRFMKIIMDKFGRDNYRDVINPLMKAYKTFQETHTTIGKKEEEKK